ncbi:MAG: bifunctional oligoribonuclease/PAP phosphatase NrnA [Brevinematales bacterium]|nr:bifunctional oligoribonuclease/PAP phosphatase NrnA [Brevinematales bacterium]
MKRKNKGAPFFFRLHMWWILRRYHRFLVTTHVRPDGDAIGSSLALVSFLTSQGKEVSLVLEEPLDPKYAFLSFPPSIVVWKEDLPPPPRDVAFVLDSGDLSRVGKVYTWLSKTTIINIDHHKDNTFFGHINWVDPLASSVGEMLARWLGKHAKGEIAQSLFVSIATDTGFFRFPNAHPYVYRIAADLLERGASQTLVYERIYQNRPYGFLLLVEKLLSHLELHMEGKLAIGYVSFEDMTSTHCYDTEGLLEYLALIEGVTVYVLLKEKEKNQISVSFRTKADYDMGLLAKEFGGGGHAKAAGCLVEGNILQWKQTILETTVRYLERYGEKLSSV